MTTFATPTAQIESLYLGYFGRAADPQGETYWVNQLNLHTVTLAQIAASFSIQPEALAKYPYLQSPSTGNPHDFITAVYNQLFGHGPDAAGEAFWTAQLAAAQGSPAAIGSMILNIISGATGTDSTVVTNRVTVATDFTAQATNKGLPWTTSYATQSATELATVNDTAASVTAAIGATTTFFAGQFPTFTLTQNIDSPTTGFTTGGGATATVAGSIFNANPVVVAGSGLANNTLNIGDNLQATGAAAGSTTLNYTTTSGGIIGANPGFATNVTMAGVNVLNIQNANLPPPGPGGTTVAGFQGNITGLLVENNNNSVNAVTLGGTGQGLNTLLTDINIKGYGGAPGDDMNTVILATAIGSAAATIKASFSGTDLGTTAAGGAMEFAISNDTGGGTAASPNLTYGTWALKADSNVNLQLEQSVTTALGTIVAEGGVGGATALTLAGAGNIALGQAVAGDWQLLQTIDSSASTGKVFITGATSGVASQAFATVANPGWLFGSDVGLLDDTGGTFNLTKMTLGTGQTFLDVSSASAAQVAKLTTAGGAGLVLNASNEIIVKDSVATTLSADTFKNIAGFSQLGIGGPAAADGAGGIINMALLPASINTFIYQTKASADVTINNQVTSLTVNTEDNGNNKNLTVGKVGPAAGLSDSFTLIVGNTFQNNNGNVGNVRLFGEEKVTISSVGGNTNDVDQVLITSTSNIPMVVNIDGNKNIDIGNSGGPQGGAIAHVNDPGNALILNSMQIFITNTGVTTFHGSNDGGSVLDYAIAGDTADGSGSPTGNPLSSSTNAVLIDAHTSGGLIMEAGNSNFVVSATVGGSSGSTMIGSETAGNVLGGSIGNDIFISSKNAATDDTIYTGGGADKVTLTIGNGVDRVELFSAFDSAGTQPGQSAIPRFHSITDGNDVPQLGWWGQATGGTATGYSLITGAKYAGLSDGQGTNADETKVSGFQTGAAGDHIDIGADSGPGHGSIWGTGGNNGLLGGAVHGLVRGDLTSITVGGDTNAVFQNVNNGQTVNAATTVVKLVGQEFFDATSVATLLSNNTYDLKLGAALNANDSAHMIIAYQDFNGNTHISDLALIANAIPVVGFTTNEVDLMGVRVADMVQLTGVALSSLDQANIQFV